MPRVDIYVDQFDELIRQKGMNVFWEEAMICNCIREDTSQPDFNCSKCKGSGFIYLAPIQTKLITTVLNGKLDFTNIGMIQAGTAYGTSLSTVLMGYHDRLLFPDFNSKYSEILVFNDGKSSKLHKPIKQVIKIFNEVAEYQIDVDFKISEDQYYIEWINPETWLEDGTKVSILYVTSPSYIIIDIMHELRGTWVEFKMPQDTFKELPKQFLLKREDFMYDRDNNRFE